VKVYIVEFGEYSDRNVSGVYSTEERAQIAAASGGDITEYEVDIAFDLYDKGLRPFLVIVAYSGDVLKVNSDEYSTNTTAYWRIATTDFALWPNKPTWNCIDVYTWARDEQHAIKIASELHAEAVAMGWDGVTYFNSTVIPQATSK